MLPFRELLKKDSKFYWNDQLDTLFNEAKNVILKQVQNGKEGLGFYLAQKHCSCDIDMAPNLKVTISKLFEGQISKISL